MCEPTKSMTWCLPCCVPKGPCAQTVYTLALKYLYRDYIKAHVYTIWVHGPLGCPQPCTGTGTQSASAALRWCSCHPCGSPRGPFGLGFRV